MPHWAHLYQVKEYAEQAARNTEEWGDEPHVFGSANEPDDITPPFPFDYLGPYTPSGWIEIANRNIHFGPGQDTADSSRSGVGSLKQLTAHIRTLWAEHPDWGYGLIRIDLDLIVVGVYRRKVKGE